MCFFFLRGGLADDSWMEVVRETLEEGRGGGEITRGG